MLRLTPERLLSVWEDGARRHPIDRALLLLAIARPDTPPEQLADVPLGTRNAVLMALQSASFGPQLPSWADCRACGERMEFELDPAQLPDQVIETTVAIEVGGHRFQRPTSRHLARIADANDEEQAALQLLQDCAEAPDELPLDTPGLRRLMDAAQSAIEAADPWSDLSLLVCCPACGQEDEVTFDIAGYLWEEIDSHAQDLLDDIHSLAGAYGWTESEILALSNARRNAYLQRVQA